MATGNLLVLIGTSTANDGFQIAMFGVEDIPYGYGSLTFFFKLRHEASVMKLDTS